MLEIFTALKKNLLVIFIFIILVILFIIGLFINYRATHSVNKDFSKVSLENVDNLMIVAHPDDELLWGGAHLIRDNYLVVCVTCGPNLVRVNEFVKVMNETNNKYIMLGYPDKTNGERDNWDSHRDNIYDDIKEIINLKDWEMIVTHNPEGEYGHIHHKMTSSLTTSAVTTNNLYYFGKYHSKKKVGAYYPTMAPISDKYLSVKKKLIGIYKSQSFVQTMFDHMYAYEDFILASDWIE